MTKTGTCKWFNDAKGFGFLIPADGSAEVFVHYTAIQDDGDRRSLTEGQSVRFDVEPTPKGLRAAHVQPI